MVNFRTKDFWPLNFPNVTFLIDEKLLKKSQIPLVMPSPENERLTQSKIYLFNGRTEAFINAEEGHIL